MTNPIKPVGPSAVSPTAPTDETAPSGATPGSKPFEVGHTQAMAPAGAASGSVLDPLQAAIREVVADIKAGRVPDATAAAEAVIIRLVNLRFSHLNEASRRKMQLHIQEMLHSDPQFHDRIESLLQAAHAP